MYGERYGKEYDAAIARLSVLCKKDPNYGIGLSYKYSRLAKTDYLTIEDVKLLVDYTDEYSVPMTAACIRTSLRLNEVLPKDVRVWIKLNI